MVLTLCDFCPVLNDIKQPPPPPPPSPLFLIIVGWGGVGGRVLVVKFRPLKIQGTGSK